MTKLPQTKGVLDFIQKYLYNSTNYKFDDGTTQAINVPYPDSGVYENYILHYPDATSTEMLDINIDQLYGEVMVLTDPKIERAYEYILEERDPGNTTTNVLITVGVDDFAVSDGSTTSYLHQLQNKYGFRAISVSIGTKGFDFRDLAESRDWYFAVTDSNSQWVADQISRIICHL
uniref:VWFA domain-containing protein n=1 Tax=Caenorhabditis tropicalis TaxID=1561998 RepID=A0A1I7TV08_9PELO